MTRTSLIVLCTLAALCDRPSPRKNCPTPPSPPAKPPLRMTVPDGFKVTLFAGEPDVVQPIAFTFDDRGRLWVVECLSYPKWTEPTARQGKDRVLIFEDTDGDGTLRQAHRLPRQAAPTSPASSSASAASGSARTPNLLFIPDQERRRQARRPARGRARRLGPASRATTSSTASPGARTAGSTAATASLDHVAGRQARHAATRTASPINCGVWRYHPTRKMFEVVAHGTTNPWGLDFDEHGEMFITNCVIDHLWHVVPGGHYERMYGQDLNPHTLRPDAELRRPHPLGRRPAGPTRAAARASTTDAGGGHAHAGCMIYLGDNWPDRVPQRRLQLQHPRQPHQPRHPRTQGLRLRRPATARTSCSRTTRGSAASALDYGPDGGVYVSDWSDTGECHNYKVAHTTTGRIYKIVHGKPKPWQGRPGEAERRGTGRTARAQERLVRPARAAAACRNDAAGADSQGPSALMPGCRKIRQRETGRA